MHDEKMMEACRVLGLFVLMLLMLVTVILQLAAFNALLHAFLCSLVLLLITVSLVFDGILKDGKSMFTHGAWYALWFFNLIMNLPKI